MEPEEQVNNFLQPILEYFDSKDNWNNTRFSKFTLMIIICNGSKHYINNEIDGLSYSSLI
jgi:hypothetical protein